MPILSAKLVRQPRRSRACDGCNRWIWGAHVYLYGMAFSGDKPTGMRLCRNCVAGSTDPKVAAAMSKAVS